MLEGEAATEQNKGWLRRVFGRDINYTFDVDVDNRKLKLIIENDRFFSKII